MTILNSARIRLLDYPRLIAQLYGLERRTSRGGRDSIDHAPGGRDDLANAVAGAIVGAQARGGTSQVYVRPDVVRPAIEERPSIVDGQRG